MVALAYCLKNVVLRQILYRYKRSSIWCSPRLTSTDIVAAQCGSQLRNMDTASDSKHDVEVTLDKTPRTSVKEGKAEVLFPSTHDVFYNPVQEFNRDMSVAVIQEFINIRREEQQSDLGSSTDAGEYKVTILEALAASGLRSIRYALEIDGVERILANDYSRQAVESMRANIEHNNVAHLVEPNEGEAALLMHKYKSSRFDVVDLDPYGSPAPFLDSAVQAVKDKGLLLVTCTDMAVLCGNASETCRAKYGSVSLKTKCCHELALRIILQSIESHANRYGRYTVPLLSLSADFYVRVFVRVYTGPAMVKKSTSKLGMVYLCSGCESFSFQPLGRCIEKGKSVKFKPAQGPPVGTNCPHCSHSQHLGGPIWLDPLHDKGFVQRLITSIGSKAHLYGTSRRMLGVLHVLAEELDVPLYYILDRLTSVVHVTTPNMLQARSALLNAGHKVSLSHAAKNSLKTDAPAEFIWDMMRTWKKQHPSARPLETGTPGEVIMRSESKASVDFALHPEANPESREKQLLRYQVNPERYWGPKTRAKTSLWSGKEEEKRARRQGKRQQRNGSAELPPQKRPLQETEKVSTGEEGDRSSDTSNKS
ncbi:tRNA (guanine(26)-N(2))-dimethyltransferase-like [Ornithodoros turicata]|uniref:tRNA (guanine(26)-N(2))-dimethyltransferase-like n=1 Tax=Ornithodoros turicata TaxID=34597 RepID=UPI003138A1D2